MAAPSLLELPPLPWQLPDRVMQPTPAGGRVGVGAERNFTTNTAWNVELHVTRSHPRLEELRLELGFEPRFVLAREKRRLHRGEREPFERLEGAAEPFHGQEVFATEADV